MPFPITAPVVDEDVALPQTSMVWRFWLPWLPVLFFVGGVAALAIDCPLAKWCIDHRGHWPWFVKELFQFGESFANGLGAVVFILAAFQLAPKRRWAIPRVITIVVGSALAADLVKLLVTRDRPYHFDFSGGVWTTFGQWFSWANVESVHQSLPSGHTAVAVSLAIALTWHYPRGGWLFSALAFLAACQRLQCSAHYLSDVMFAAAVGSAVAVICLCIGPVPRWFDRWESSWKPKPSGGGLKRSEDD
jgi:membrane-associated phospholipid phosphatase